MSGFSYMAPWISLVIPQDLILTRLLLAIFPNSFGKNICRCVLQNSVDCVAKQCGYGVYVYSSFNACRTDLLSVTGCK